MKHITIVRELTGAGSEVLYVPVPCKGIVKGVKVVSDLQMDATGLLTISRGATAVNLVTVPAGNIAAGVVLAGVPDTTNKDLVFDPDSATVAEKVIKIVDDANFLGGAGTVTILIDFDEFAYVKQAASEA
jgi:hypothetical protein